MSTLKSFLSILFISQTIHARSFNPCELENVLSTNYNLTVDESRNLTCVAQKYSQLTTNIINNGSKTIYYGIFQIGQKWCGIDKPGGKCNIKCEDLVDDDIKDDIKCAQQLFRELGKKAWKLNKKNSGCKKEFNYLDENCHKNANIDDTFQVQPDFCELARKLMTLYDISKIDATIWSCISQYSKTGNLNQRAEEENGRDDEESCVKTRDVECAIKNNKQTGNSGNSFEKWPAYEQYCKNITESTCFEGTNSVNRSDIIEQIKNVQYTETSIKPKIFTTSTEVSVFIEDDDGNLTQYDGNDITSESPNVSKQTTEFLSNTLENPSYEDKPTIEGYSKVRIMSADKQIVELPETLESTSKTLDEITLINSSLAKSTTDSISAELSHTKHTTEKIEAQYYETIDKCALAKDMNDSGRIPQNLISTFICIAEHESGLNVSFIDSDGQQSKYGLFQIDNQIYCNTNDNINQCNVLCAHLVDDHFDNDFECVRHIYKKEGLNYWPSYEKSCKNINSNSLDYCFEQFTTSQRPSTILNREAEYHSTEGTSEATLNDLTHMEMTTLINGIESAPNDGSLDFCEFSHQLKVNMSIGIWEDLVHYVCIADQISHLRPKLLNDDKFGIFSLKDNTCGKYEAGGICSILCSNLLNDDLIDDAECMIKVYKELGLKAWNIDKESCKAYTPKILRCIDEGKFSIPSDDESDDKEDLLITPESKDDEITKDIENNLEMTLSRSNAGVKTVESIEDVKTLDQTTVSSIETTSYMEDTSTESGVYLNPKSNIQKEEFHEKEKESTTDGQKLTEELETTEKIFEEESVEAIKNLPDIDTSDKLESTTFDTKNDEENEQTTNSIKYDDDESSKNEEEASVEINLLTTTIESLLSSEIVDKDLAQKNDDVPQTTVEVDEVTEEVQTTLKKFDEQDETEAIPKTEHTTVTENDSEETTLRNDSNESEYNQTHKDDNTENGREELESSLEEDLEFTTESLLKNVDQKIEDLKNTLFEIAESQKYTGTENQKNIEMESDTTKPEDNLTTDNPGNIESGTKQPENNLNNELEFTSESLDQISDQEFENLRNNLFTTLDSIDQNNDEIESDTLTSVNNLTTENDSNTENETENIKRSQTTEIYDILEDKTVPEISKTKNFLEEDEKLIHEEATSDIPMNNDDKTETFDPEASKSFLENTEESSEEESTTNSLNIESISTEYSINQSDSLTQNTEKYIERETTTNNEMTKQHTEDQIYLESTTESSFSRKVLDITDSIYEFMRKVNEDNSEQTTESEELIKTELDESTLETAVFDKESNIVVNTEEPPTKATTESLYYTSIREIIEEYQKVNVKNLDNVQSKRNKNFSYDETTLDGLVDDYDDFVDELENPDEFIESLNQHTTLPITLSSIKIPQISRINKCELARYMNVSGFPENLIPTLICIAEHESELNPLAVKITKSHNKYGLFQIDDSIYCSTDENINECEIRCELLTDNQFDNDFECVRQIYKKEGFNYWSSYEKSCNNVSANALDYCYEEISTSHRLEFENSTPEMSQIEDIPVTTDSTKIILEALSIDNELKSIIRTFELCELTRELYSRNISMDDIPQYLCIADIKSHLKIRIPNENEQNYGLFFIDSEFCGQNESDGICSMKCSELWDTNISDDVDCVFKVIQTNGTDKWNLNSEVCQIYDNKVLECFDKTTELPKISQIDFDEIKRNANVSQHDVITKSERMTDMISDMTDKNFEDLDHEITKLRSSNLDIESDEMTTDETTTPLEPTTSRIIQILTSTASTENIDSIKVDKQIRRVPVININLPRDLLKDQNLSKQVNTLIKNFTYYDVLPTNGSIIFNIFNFNIYGEDHDIKFSINPGTDLKDVADD